MSDDQKAVMLYGADPVCAAKQIGEWFAKSGMFGCKSVEQGQVLALACIAERKNPIQILREYHMIDGRLSMRADAMLAGFRQGGGKYKVLARTADKAAIEMSVDGNTEKFSLTWDEAKHEPFVSGRDGKLKTNWATPRARMQMLWARVVSDAVRTMMPEVVAGAYTPEEIGDMVPQRKVVDVAAMVETPPPEVLQPEVLPPAKDTDGNSDVQKREVDHTVMPVGPKAGQKFSDFTLKQLQTIRKKGAEMSEFTPDHIAAVDAAIAAKEQENGAKND